MTQISWYVYLAGLSLAGGCTLAGLEWAEALRPDPDHTHPWWVRGFWCGLLLVTLGNFLWLFR